MKTLWILAAAATFAACHNRSSDETGAAPDRGDSTMTTIDTTTPAPNPSASGYDTTTAAPTVPSDTTAAPRALTRRRHYQHHHAAGWADVRHDQHQRAEPER